MDVSVQLMFLQMLQQGTTGAVHDTFGYTGGARGIHDVQRVIKRQLHELDLAARRLRSEVIKQDCPGDAGQVRGNARIGHDNDPLQAGQCRDNLDELVQ